MADLSSKIRRGDGCGYLLAVCAITCVLFLLNGMMATVLYVRLRPFLPEWATRARYFQLFLLAVPVALIFLEWYIYDWFVARLSRSPDNTANNFQNRHPHAD